MPRLRIELRSRRLSPPPFRPVRAGKQSPATQVERRKIPTICFTPAWNHTAPGWKPAITDMFGNHAKLHPAIGVLTPTVIGSIPMRAGPGSRKNGSDGPLIITVGGRVYETSAGSGFQAMNGPRHGSPGARVTTT